MSKGKIVVTGGCGYIGSHAMLDLIEHGYEVLSIDNLINSNEASLDGIYKVTGIRPLNYKLDLSAQGVVQILLKELSDIRAVIHFAALKSVEESVKNPLLYFQNNIKGMIHILQWMDQAHIPHLIFSSSCTVYGVSKDLPVTELSPILKASSPYGRTKQICEQIIQDSISSFGGKSISLRYFNPAGAHMSNEIGESPLNAPLNLVPVITETAIGVRNEFTVHGNDYPTSDGSCVRDYIHVMDLASAHTRALEYLENYPNTIPFDVFNLGLGQGISVLEAIRIFEDVNRIKVKYSIGPRRSGDIPSIYANTDKAREKLSWEPKYSMEDIMRTAWNWEKKRQSVL